MSAPHGRPRRAARWALVTVLVAAVAVTPQAIASLPVEDRPEVTAQQVTASVLASARVQHSGTAESRGELDLPDVRRLGNLVALLGGTTRTRVWWAGPDRWRVDEQGATADVSTYRDEVGTWTWDSDEGTAVRVVGEPALRLPRPADLGPADVGRRLLAAADGARSTRIGARRIAGRTGLGVSVRPDDPRSLVESVQVWADSATGLPLRVEVTAVGTDEPTAVSTWLDLSVEPPHSDALTFRPSAGVEPSWTEAPDVVSLIDRFGRVRLPAELTGVPRREAATGIGGRGGVGTYGDGLATFAVLPLPRDIARETFRSLESAAGVREVAAERGEVLALETPLLSAVVARGDRRGYLLAGPVLPAVLEDAASELLADPPGRREGGSR